MMCPVLIGGPVVQHLWAMISLTWWRNESRFLFKEVTA